MFCIMRFLRNATIIQVPIRSQRMIGLVFFASTLSGGEEVKMPSSFGALTDRLGTSPI